MSLVLAKDEIGLLIKGEGNMNLEEIKKMNLEDLEVVNEEIGERINVLERKAEILKKRQKDNADALVLEVEPEYDPDLLSQMEAEIVKESKELKDILDHLPTLMNIQKSRIRMEQEKLLKVKLLEALADGARILSKESRSKKDMARLSEIKGFLHTNKHKSVVQRMLFELGLRDVNKAGISTVTVEPKSPPVIK